MYSLPSLWVHFMNSGRAHYSGFAGLVTLGRVPICSYALSFIIMFENLGKSVILTGSQVDTNC